MNFLQRTFAKFLEKQFLSILKTKTYFFKVCRFSDKKERKKEREREKDRQREFQRERDRVCVCVKERMRERE